MIQQASAKLQGEGARPKPGKAQQASATLNGVCIALIGPVHAAAKSAANSNLRCQAFSGNASNPPPEWWADADAIYVASETAYGVGGLSASGQVIAGGQGQAVSASAKLGGNGGLTAIGSMIATGGASMHGGM